MNRVLKRLQPPMLDVLCRRYEDNAEVARRWTDVEIFCAQWVTEEGLIGGATNPMSPTLMLCYAICALHETLGRTLTHDEFMHVYNGAMGDSLESLGFIDWNELEGNHLLMGCIHLIVRGYETASSRLRGGAWKNTWSVRTNPERHEHGVAFVLDSCPINDFARAHGYLDVVRWMCACDQLMPPVFHAHLIRHKTLSDGDDCCEYWYVGDRAPEALADTGSK